MPYAAPVSHGSRYHRGLGAARIHRTGARGGSGLGSAGAADPDRALRVVRVDDPAALDDLGAARRRRAVGRRCGRARRAAPSPRRRRPCAASDGSTEAEAACALTSSARGRPRARGRPGSGRACGSCRSTSAPSSQSRSQALRQVIVRPQRAHGLVGSGARDMDQSAHRGLSTAEAAERGLSTVGGGRRARGGSRGLSTVGSGGLRTSSSEMSATVASKRRMTSSPCTVRPTP